MILLHHRLIQIIHSYVPLGAALWLLTWLVPLYDQTERIILLAAFVVVPLALFAVFNSTENAALPAHLKLLAALLPAGAVLLAVSFALAPGAAAGILAVPWSAATFAIAALGARLILGGAGRDPAVLVRAIGLMYIAVAGVWLTAHQFGVPLLGFGGQIMLLTVNHFHYAGFVVPVLLGFLLEVAEFRQAARRLAGLAAVLGVLAPILIALGMTFSPALEWVSVLVFTGALLLYSLLVLGHLVPQVVPRHARWTRLMHVVSAGAVWGTMALAAWYGYGEWSGTPTISISNMILLHGWGNAVLLSFVGVLAWHATIMGGAAAAIPFSRLQGFGRIGANIFHRLHAVDESGARRPSGLSDDFREYGGGGFQPDRLHPDIVDFYEHTANYHILVEPRWHPAFRPLARVYKLVSDRVEQMNFPLEAERSARQIRSEILPLQDAADGRTNVRAWVRTYADTGKAIYAAAYSTHRSERDGVRYMNIAFPLPGGQMTSVLRLSCGENGVLTLTSWPGGAGGTADGDAARGTAGGSEASGAAGGGASSGDAGRDAASGTADCGEAGGAGGGDQGVYWVRQGGAKRRTSRWVVRLPINETITVWKEDGAPRGRIEARHEMWLYGVRFLTLSYRIFRKGTREGEWH